jgi:thymidylate synthase
MSQWHDFQYFNIVKHALTGVEKPDRTGTGTRSVFAHEERFALTDGTIPLLTTKKMHTRSIIYELLWYLRGDTNIKYLNDNGVTIWDEWATESGELGPVYGEQWRAWHTPGQDTVNIDQIANVIDLLRTTPDSRRMLVSAWNVGELASMALPPCHYSFQFWTADGKLSMIMNQRSCDVGLGVPYNIVQYSILLRMIAQVTGFVPGEFIWRGGDVHIYKNHVEQLVEQLERDPHPSPVLKLNPNVKEIDDFKYSDFEIVGYKSHPKIKMEVSV